MQRPSDPLDSFPFNAAAYLQAMESIVDTLDQRTFNTFLNEDRKLMQRYALFSDMHCNERQKTGDFPAYDSYREEVSVIFASACTRPDLLAVMFAHKGLPLLDPFVMNIDPFLRKDQVALFALFFESYTGEDLKMTVANRYRVSPEKMPRTNVAKMTPEIMAVERNAVEVVKLLHENKLSTAQDIYDAAIFFRKMNIVRYIIHETTGIDYYRHPYGTQLRPLFQICSADYSLEENRSPEDPYGEELFEEVSDHNSSFMFEIFISKTCLTNAVRARNEGLTQSLLHIYGRAKAKNVINAEVGRDENAFSLAIKMRMSLETMQVFVERGAIVSTGVVRMLDELEDGEYKRGIMQLLEKRKRMKELYG